MFNQLLINNVSYLWNQNAERSSDDRVRAQGDRRRGIGIGCYGFDPVERQIIICVFQRASPANQ